MEHYGMFSDTGNKLVNRLIKIGVRHRKTWPQILLDLKKLSKNRSFRESSDTAVTENAFENYITAVIAKGGDKKMLESTLPFARNGTKLKIKVKRALASM